MSNALFEAIDRHDAPCVEALLRTGIDPNAALSVPPGWLPLGAAIEELEFGGSVEVVRLLLEHGADVNRPYIDERVMPLNAALCFQRSDAFRLILSAGADANALNSEGDTPLRVAVTQDAQEMAALLLKHGARRTIDDSGGFCGLTALGIAALALNVPMVHLLLHAGADSQTRDSDGWLAVDHLPARTAANARQWDEVVDLLATEFGQRASEDRESDPDAVS